tara:strand:+ start:594 stop:908 length:315 start_codon:yes stop_codon:yes gene_type:complete
MTTLEIILLLCSTLLFFLFLVSLYFNVKHGILIIKLTESIESALDILDEKYSSISKVLEIPLFYDSPQVKNVVEDIKNCRDSLLESAKVLTEVDEEQYEEKKSN